MRPRLETATHTRVWCAKPRDSSSQPSYRRRLDCTRETIRSKTEERRTSARCHLFDLSLLPFGAGINSSRSARRADFRRSLHRAKPAEPPAAFIASPGGLVFSALTSRRASPSVVARHPLLLRGAPCARRTTAPCPASSRRCRWRRAAPSRRRAAQPGASALP